MSWLRCAGIWSACACLGFAYLSGCARAAPVQAPETVASALLAVPEPAAERLLFSEFFAPGAGLRPSQKLRSLVGKRVRLVGFMAQLELPPKGAFYLAARPVRCDESGAGTADLPPATVLVVSRASAGQVVPFLSGALELTGTLELGNQPDTEGRVSAFRLRLDAS